MTEEGDSIGEDNGVAHLARLPGSAPVEKHTVVPVELTLPGGFVELVARRVADLLDERSSGPEPWLTVEQAAAHLAAPRSRVYALTSRRGPDRIPHERDGSRLLFKASELDEWVRRGGGTRP